MKFERFDEVVKFHGHSCPGLALGYRVALAAIEELGIKRAEDEEIVCIVENDSCAVDAIQVMTGCTFGKGNLLYRDYGKQVYTFFDRKKGKAVRISIDFEFTETDEEKTMWRRFTEGERTKEILDFINRRKAEKTKQILNAEKEQLIKISYPSFNPPNEARIFKSLRCEQCGEKVAEIKARLLNGKTLCIPCFEAILCKK